MFVPIDPKYITTLVKVPMIIVDPNTILGFLSGSSSDYKNRFIDEIIAWDDEQLERCADQFQWIFPLHEESSMAFIYPVIDKNIVELSEDIPEVRDNIIFACERFKKFLGVGDYLDEEKQKKWCTKNNHNFLRITRVIRSLRLFGCENEALDFYKSIVECPMVKINVDLKTKSFWKKAMFEGMWQSIK